jgi:pimeloyl-ACP methyl ester carboxylesterase
MQTLRSADGTTIAFESAGAGPPLVIVVGAFCDRDTFGGMAAQLADAFTVFRYDRRGRGGSGDAPDYAVAREIEDLAAVIGVAGGAAAVVGHSSGAALALAAATAGLPISRLVAYEPPYREGRQVHEQTVGLRIAEHIAAGRLDDAVAHFFISGAGMAPELLTQLRAGPDWPRRVSYARTLPYEIAVAGEQGVPKRLAEIQVPTLLLTGAQSWPWIQESAAAAAATIPSAQLRILADQGHEVRDAAFAAPVREFATS